MSLPRVGIVHAPGGAATLKDIGLAARGLCEPVLVFTEPIAASNQDLVSLSRRLFPVVVTPEDAMTQTMAGLGLAGLTTFHDTFIEYADNAITALNMPGTGQPAHVWDKLVQRQRLGAAGLTRIRALPVDRPEDLVAAAAALGLPAVLKPRRGVGSQGVAFVGSPEDVNYQLGRRSAWRDLMLEDMIPPGVHPSGLPHLADFVSVESLSMQAEHQHAVVFDKTLGVVVRRAGESGADGVHLTGNLVPSRLPDQVAKETCDHVAQCLAALDVRWRVTHAEVKLTWAGPELIEINGRVGGNLMPLLRLVNGPDLVQAALSLALGRRPQWRLSLVDGFAGGLKPVFRHGAGLVQSRVSAADLRMLPGVFGVEEVAAYGQPRAETEFRMAKVAIRAQSAEEFDDYILSTLDGIETLFAADAPHSNP